jgi:hypothetical protein
VDRLLQLLLQCSAKTDSGLESMETPSGSNSTNAAASELHPLLCVRVLQRLGYAMCACADDSSTSSSGGGNESNQATKGWAVRHVYPSLTVTRSAVVTAGELPPPSPTQSSLSPRQAQALATVAAVVLGPLLPLLGDGTPQRPPHTQANSVIPVAVEWLCTLPTAEASLPLQRWLPWVVAQYSHSIAACARGGDGIAEDVREEGEAAHVVSGGASIAQAPFACLAALPPLKEVLPRLMAKLAPYLTAEEDPFAAPAHSGSPPLPAVCERQLSILLRLCRESTDPNGGDRGRVTLGETLWWSGEEPLVRLPGVRRALSRMSDGDAGEADTMLLLLRPAEGGEAARVAGITDGQTSGTTRVSAAATSSGVGLVRLPATMAGTAFFSAAVPQLTLRVIDDDVYRRFFLRLTALQHALVAQQQRESQHQPRLGDGVSVKREAIELLLSLELCESLTEDNNDSDPDVILRFIQPLYEYVALLQDGMSDALAASASCAGDPSAADPKAVIACAPVRLTFTAVVQVLTAVFHRLEELKLQSRCRGAAASHPAHRQAQTDDTPSPAATTAFTLLPQKSRLHTLKRLCEVLLHHVRSVQAVQAEAAQRNRASLATGEAAPPSHARQLWWFVDVDGRQQEVVLRRFCGAARALVRVVMEERRVSLVEEGPEGSVLTASSITAAHRTRQRDAVVATTDTGGKETRSVPSDSAAMATASSDVGAVREGLAAASVASFDHTLRTLAFRVAEPALWRLYEACAQWQVSPPLHMLSFKEWLVYLNAVSDGVGDDGGGNGSPRDGLRRTSVLDCQGQVLPQALQPYTTVMEAARSLYESVGGRPGLQMAQQVLPRPGQQSISALVEGIRLTALQCFVFDGLHVGTPFALADRAEHVELYCRWVLEHTSAALFSVWQRTSSPPREVAANRTFTDGAVAHTTAAHEAVEEGQRQLRHRLGLLTLSLHIHVLMHAQRGRRARNGVEEAGAEGIITNVLPSSLTSLLRCLVSALPTLSPSSPSPLSLSHPNYEWSLVTSATTTILQLCRCPPCGNPSGCTSLWELVEELNELADDSVDEGVVTWTWLGSPAALWDVVREATAVVEGSAAATPSPRLFLLPWTTVAHSHQPFRVYDESGQSQRAAAEWEATLQTWLMGSENKPAAHHTNPGALKDTDGLTLPPLSRPVVRLISIVEELRFFAELQHQPSMQLSPEVRVVCEEVRREVEVVAPAVRCQLQSWKGDQRSPAREDSLKAEKGWYTEEDYDGLD